MMAAVLWGEVDVTWLLPWVGAVLLVNLAAMQLARTQAVTQSGARAIRCRSGR